MLPSGEKTSPERACGRKLPHLTPAVRRPEDDVTVLLATCEQPTVGREGERDLIAGERRLGGRQRGEALAAGQIANLDAGRGRNRELRAVRAQGQPEHAVPQAQRRPDQLRPVGVPDPHGAGGRGVPVLPPGACRSENASRAEGEHLPAPRPRVAGCAEERPDSLPGPGVPEADAAALLGHRQPAPVGRVLDRAQRPAGKGLEAAGPAQRLAVDQVHPAGVRGDREGAPVGAGGEAWRPGLERVGVGVGAEWPQEPAVAGHVPDHRRGVHAGRVEGAPVGAEHLVPGPRRGTSKVCGQRSRIQVPQDSRSRLRPMSTGFARRG